MVIFSEPLSGCFWSAEGGSAAMLDDCSFRSTSWVELASRSILPGSMLLPESGSTEAAALQEIARWKQC